MNKSAIAKRVPNHLAKTPIRNLLSGSLFDDLFDTYLSDRNDTFNQMMNVSMDVAETEQSYEVKVDLPGFQPDEVDIQLEQNTLMIRGSRGEDSEQADPEKRYHRVERYRGSFARSVVLPSSINEDEAVADFKDGVLSITIPKSEEAKPRKIRISK